MFKYVTPQGTFLIYAVLTFLGIFFIEHFIYETSHLTEKEKRKLYKVNNNDDGEDAGIPRYDEEQ